MASSSASKLCAMRSWAGHGARVTERIGHPQAEKSVSLIAIHNHGLRDRFGEDVLRDLDALPELTMAHREDLTRVPLVTIDPEDAKDHDDAVWATPDPDPANDGGAVAIVAIADVSFYVRPGTALDHEASLARQFGLLPGPGRADAAGEAVERSVLAARRRAAPVPRRAHDLRPQRQEALAPLRARHDALRGEAFLSRGAGGHRRQARAKTAPLLDTVLRPLWRVYAILKEARDKRGPLDLDLPERKIILDDLRARVARHRAGAA